MAVDLAAITNDLVTDLARLSFGPPVAFVYNPLIYARRAWDRYVALYGRPPREILLVGMNPGPWGMAQTGVPFGEVAMVRDWLGIEEEIGRPERQHPKKPVTGFACHRSEVSGRRLWGWVRQHFQEPARFFERFFVANYCPLLFMDDSGRNLTPNTLPAAERGPLLECCDRALARTVQCFQPRLVIGIGRFAADRARAALAGSNVEIGVITHPSPANPKANRGWAPLVEKELADLGIRL